MCFVGVMDTCMCCGVSILWFSWCLREHEVFSVLGGCVCHVVWVCVVIEPEVFLLYFLFCQDGLIHFLSVGDMLSLCAVWLSVVYGVSVFVC